MAPLKCNCSTDDSVQVYYNNPIERSGLRPVAAKIECTRCRKSVIGRGEWMSDAYEDACDKWHALLAAEETNS